MKLTTKRISMFVSTAAVAGALALVPIAGASAATSPDTVKTSVSTVTSTTSPTLVSTTSTTGRGILDGYMGGV